MLRRVVKIWPLAAAVFLLAGCGAGSISIDDSEYDLTQNISKSVWHDGNGIVGGASQTLARAFIAPIMLLEDGNYYNDVLVTKTPGRGSSTIYGIYQIDIPDADDINFKAKIGFPYSENPSIGNLIFKLSIQDGNEFPVLAELQTSYDRDLKVIEADMTRYRGKMAFLMLSVQATGTTSDSLSGIWLEPKISYEFY